MSIFRNIKRYFRRRKEERRRFRSADWGNMWNFRHGFYAKTVELCGVTKENYQDFISDVDYWKGHPYNGIYSSIIDNKLYLPMLLHQFKEYVPRYFFFKDNCGFLPLDSGAARVRADAVLDKLREEGALACKRVADSFGNGFFLMEYIDEEKAFLNKEIISVHKLKTFLSELNDCIITEVVKNHPYAVAIAPNSLNTIRLLLVWDAEKCCFFIARAFHRFGCAGSIVDNLSAGNGLLVYVNPETGELLGEGIISENGKETYIRGEIRHPDTDVKLTGMFIPSFADIAKKCLDIFATHSYLRYLGLDIAVISDGFKIIEINSLTSLVTIQQRSGLLADPRIRAVLKH